ncbi:MAG: hypothetical protein RR413_11095, partial [Christensenellaceae bacterium]
SINRLAHASRIAVRSSVVLPDYKGLAAPTADLFYIHFITASKMVQLRSGIWLQICAMLR